MSRCFLGTAAAPKEVLTIQAAKPAEKRGGHEMTTRRSTRSDSSSSSEAGSSQRPKPQAPTHAITTSPTEELRCSTAAELEADPLSMIQNGRIYQLSAKVRAARCARRHFLLVAVLRPRGAIALLVAAHRPCTCALADGRCGSTSVGTFPCQVRSRCAATATDEYRTGRLRQP